MPKECSGKIMLSTFRIKNKVQGIGRDLLTTSYTCGLESLIQDNEVMGHNCTNCPYHEMNEQFFFGCISFLPQNGSRVI